MTTNETPTMVTDETSVTLERAFHATPERLFEAWTNPDLTSRWLAPGPMTCNLPVYDARKGGPFRIEMTGPGPDGTEHTFAHEGTFEDLAPGKRVVMAWPPPSPDATEADPPSLVTVTFTPTEDGTLLRLTQDGFPNEEFAEGAGSGWTSALEKLAGVL